MAASVALSTLLPARCTSAGSDESSAALSMARPRTGSEFRSLASLSSAGCCSVQNPRMRDWTPRSGRRPESELFLADEEEEVGPNVVPSPPPSTGRIEILVTKEAIRELDLSRAHSVLRKYVHRVGDNLAEPPEPPQELLERTLGFVFQYERDDPFDPRELSEMPDIRLWFVRLDAAYPWLPIALDWRAGELARYAAMLVPHQMSRKQGLVFNPEALELFAMGKVFAILPWLRARGVKEAHTRITGMMKMLGLGVSKEFFGLINRHPPPP